MNASLELKSIIPVHEFCALSRNQKCTSLLRLGLILYLTQTVVSREMGHVLSLRFDRVCVVFCFVFCRWLFPVREGSR